MIVGRRLERLGLLSIVVIAGVWLAYVASAAAPTQPAAATLPSTQATFLGPDIVMMKELTQLYEPVPFDHKTHAKMAQMWDGCVTCHHRTPQAATRPASTEAIAPLAREQQQSTWVPACKSCHAITAEETNIHMPSLKGAYHRQCLNCHIEWMHGNACVVCHKAKGTQTAATTQPTRDDVVGRMHPPIPEPITHLYKMRYTPADGGNVLFRHKEHTADFGLRCISCHHKDNCSHCHDPNGDKTAQKPVHPGMTWADSHGPCMSCHQQDRCQHCHYKDDQTPPKVFAHAMTGQQLDAEHDKLSCLQCHAGLKTKSPPTCGDSSCHKKDPAIAFPARRPGPIVAIEPASRPVVRKIPTTRPG